MQKVSKAYKEAMKQPLRNRGYIKASIGVINSDAQKNAYILPSKNNLTYYSNIKDPFNNYAVEKEYATAEQNFSKVDGSMYFLPKKNSGMKYYNNGLVSDTLLGSVYIVFGGYETFDLKGLTIDFGECYPTLLTIEHDGVAKDYDNDNQVFVTEDVFMEVSYLKITAHQMVNGNGRMRIHEINMGIVNTFSNKEVIEFSFKEYVSPICETIPSEDMTLTVDNHNLYYCPDNPESTLAFFEQGQEIKVSFGYDLTGTGKIEWVAPKTCFLKSWSATDTQAKFTAVDRFDYIDSTYYKGKYREDGINLYDLAIDVLHDMGITDEREYYLGEYLKEVIVFNPIPKIKHSQALQLISNAGRCSLYIDRNKRICMEASFVPDFYASCNGEMPYSHVENITNGEDKRAYAEVSQDFSIVNNTLLFMPSNGIDYFEDTGYVSSSIYRVLEDNQMSNLPMTLGRHKLAINKHTAYEEYWEGETPVITIDLEAPFSAFGLMIQFRNNPAREFTVETFLNDVPVNTFTYKDVDETDFVSDDEFERFDKMVITFTKGYPNSRLFIDNIRVANFTDYLISRERGLMGSPTASRKDKVKSITVYKKKYNLSEISEKSLKTDTLTLATGSHKHRVEFVNPSYGYRLTVDKGLSAEILESSDYYVLFEIKDVPSDDTEVKYTLYGFEYDVKESDFTVNHHGSGREIYWNNPLISNDELAENLEEWLAVDYLGDVEYTVPWRGDPRVDGNDLLMLEIKDRGRVLIHAYQNELKFNGAWNCTTKARKAELKWR